MNITHTKHLFNLLQNNMLYFCYFPDKKKNHKHLPKTQNNDMLNSFQSVESCYRIG